MSSEFAAPGGPAFDAGQPTEPGSIPPPPPPVRATPVPAPPTTPTPPPPPAPAPPSAPPPASPTPSATPPAAPPPTATTAITAASPAERTSLPVERHDLSDILAQLESDADTSDHADAEQPLDGPAAIDTPTVGGKLTDARDLARPSLASEIVVEVGEGIKFDPTFATFGQRAVGAIVDVLVFVLTAVPGIVILQFVDSVALALVGLLVGLLVVVAFASRALSTNGKWIGNRVAGTTVVDAVNGSFIDQGRAVLRLFGRYLISPILLVGYIVAFTDSQRRTFHDRLASTVVIRRPREVWTADDV